MLHFVFPLGGIHKRRHQFYTELDQHSQLKENWLYNRQNHRAVECNHKLCAARSEDKEKLLVPI